MNHREGAKAVEGSDRLRYRVCDSEVTIAIGDPALVPAVRELFRPYEGSCGRPRSAAPPAVGIRREGGTHLVEWGGESRECRTWSELVIAAEYALAVSLLAACGRLAHLHAAGAVVDDRGIVALGGTGAGKSSLALNWSLAGLPLLGDDVLMVDRSSRVLPFKRLVKVVPRLLEERGIDCATTPFWTPGSEEAWFDPAGAGGWAAPTPVAVVAVVRYRPGAALAVDPVDRAMMLSALLHSLLPSGLGRAASLDRLVALTSGARTFAVTYGAAAQAADALTKVRV